MARSGSTSGNFPAGGANEHGLASPSSVDALRNVLARTVASLPIAGTGPANVTPPRPDSSLTSGERPFSRTESVFLRPRSPVTTAKNVRMATQGGANAYPSPVTFGVGQEDGWRGVRRTQSAELERKDRQAQNLPNPAYDDLLNRLQ